MSEFYSHKIDNLTEHIVFDWWCYFENGMYTNQSDL